MGDVFCFVLENCESYMGFFFTLFLVYRSLRSIYRRFLLGQAQLLN
jgi:hypothetical protein